MATFKIGFLYPEHMDLYGDDGNLIIIKKRLEWLGHSVLITKIKLGQNYDLKEYDFLFMGTGTSYNQARVTKELEPQKDTLFALMEEGVPMLFMATAFQLLGQSYVIDRGKSVTGLGIFNFYVENGLHRLTGNTLISAILNGQEVSIVGFANHMARIYSEDENLLPFGLVVKGQGNNNDKLEGIRYKNFIGSNLHGPLLAKNPILADYFIDVMFKRKNINRDVILDDAIELFAHQQARTRLI